MEIGLILFEHRGRQVDRYGHRHMYEHIHTLSAEINFRSFTHSYRDGHFGHFKAWLMCSVTYFSTSDAAITRYLYGWMYRS